MKADATYRDLPGQSIYNPLGCEDPAWYLNVVSVTEPDKDEAIRISAVEGEVVVRHDMNWYELWRSPRMVTYEESLLIEERNRIGGGGS